jgi:hypothetical protein
MFDGIKSLLIGVLTGVVFGVSGIITGASLSVVLILGTTFAMIIELLLNTPKEFDNYHMETSY